ncbi:MAG: CHC2 zinc finger domain-containing protein [Vicinamibacteria bacterium]
MQVTKEGIEQIKTANELAAVVAERGIAVKRKGKSLVASCPFHREKTPSFTITPSKGLFHCFGCGVSGDVIGFVTRHDKVSFGAALDVLAKRAGLSLADVMKERPTPKRKTENSKKPVVAGELLSRVVEHYHKTFCEREDAQQYLRSRGLTDAQLILDYKIGYADGSLLERVPKDGQVREELLSLGVITKQGRELLGGCIVVPIPDPLTGKWTSLYGRGMRTERHCYLPGPFRGVVNYQSAKLSSEIILTESIVDALSFHQAGIANAIPLYGTNGFTSDHLDLLTRESVKRVVLALDNDEAGQKAAEAIKTKISSAGMAVQVVSFPDGIKDANELLVSRNGDAGDVFRELLGKTQPALVTSSPLTEGLIRQDGELVLRKNELTYHARVYPAQLGRLRATVRLERGSRFHVDTLDLYSSRSRTEFGRRISRALGVGGETIEADLLALLVEAEKLSEEGKAENETPSSPSMTEPERTEALKLLRRSDLLDQVSNDVDALGFVGEDINRRLLYLVAISRKLEDPLSAVILSQSGAGKSGLTEVIERLTPPEDVVLLTRLTPQSLYYVDPDFLDRKLVIVEERYGSIEADYSIRVLQSRKKLIAAAPIKDPQTGNLRTKVFTVEARAAFIEATTASQLNYENATRCFELAMDESVEQTKKIHERQRLMKTEDGLRVQARAQDLVKRHWNAQRLLEPLPVVIPFADKLTFPSTWMRARRDHARFLNLIEVSAFLHQYQREQKNGVILATTEDYAVAYRLARTALAETLSDLKASLKRAYERIRDLAQGSEGAVTRREIRQALQLPDSTVRRWLTELTELEYLEAEMKGQGKAVRYRLTGRGPSEGLVLGLLTPEDLTHFATSPTLATRRGKV